MGAATELGVLADAIELEQPVFKARCGIELATAYLIGLRVSGDDSHGACPTGAGADADDVGQWGLGLNIA